MTIRTVEVTSESYGRAIAALKGTPAAQILEDFDKEAMAIFGTTGAGLVRRQAAVIAHQTASDATERAVVLEEILKPARELVRSASGFNPDLAWKSMRLMNEALASRADQPAPTVG